MIYRIVVMSKLAEHLNSMISEDRKYALANAISHVGGPILRMLERGDQPEQTLLDKLHWLLTEPAWMEAHVVEDGHYRSFLNEVRLAWQVADKVGLTIEQIRPKMIARQVRYALLQTSMNSLSSNIHPDTLTIGLQTGLWDEETALTYAGQVAHGMTKVAMLTEIGAFLRERHKDEPAQEVYIDTLIAMREIDYPADYVQALITLARCLPPALLTDALAMTQEIANREDRAKVLSALAPYLSSDLMEEALEVVREIGDSDSRTTALLEGSN
jgi:hypothetical protein